MKRTFRFLFHMTWLCPCMWTYLFMVRYAFEDGITRDGWIGLGVMHYVLALALCKSFRRLSHAIIGLLVIVTFWPLAFVFMFMFGSAIGNRVMNIGRKPNITNHYHEESDW